MTRVQQLLDAQAASEGAGVRIHRAIGTAALRSLDPFLMLDFFGSDNPGDYIAGFPDHPHRGFITITYMLDGRMRHRDSMGNEGVLEPGGVQWMKAASGVVHSEMPEQQDGLMRGFQLWLNLPAAHKMDDPEYLDLDRAQIPVVDAAWGRARLIAGTWLDVTGPLPDPHTDLLYADLHVEPDAVAAAIDLRARNSFVFVYAGQARIGDVAVGERQLAVLDGTTLQLAAGDRGLRAIVVAARPLGEPVVHYGPFVMTTEDEIRTAIGDYQRGRLVRKRATTR